jgi:hypothetical protein
MLGVSAGADDEVLVDGLLLEVSSLPPQAAVTKSRDRAEAARVTRLMVWDMTISFEWIGRTFSAISANAAPGGATVCAAGCGCR